MINLTKDQAAELKTLIQNKIDTDAKNEKIADDAIKSGDIDAFLSACENEYNKDLCRMFNLYDIPLSTDYFDVVMSL